MIQIRHNYSHPVSTTIPLGRYLKITRLTETRKHILHFTMSESFNVMIALHDTRVSSKIFHILHGSCFTPVIKQYLYLLIIFNIQLNKIPMHNTSKFFSSIFFTRTLDKVPTCSPITETCNLKIKNSFQNHKSVEQRQRFPNKFISTFHVCMDGSFQNIKFTSNLFVTHVRAYL